MLLVSSVLLSMMQSKEVQGVVNGQIAKLREVDTKLADDVIVVLHSVYNSTDLFGALSSAVYYAQVVHVQLQTGDKLEIAPGNFLPVILQKTGALGDFAVPDL